MYFHAYHDIIIGVRHTPTNSKGGKNMTESKTKLNLSIDPTLKKQAQAVIDDKKTTFSKVVTDYLKSVVKRLYRPFFTAFRLNYYVFFIH